MHILTLLAVLPCVTSMPGHVRTDDIVPGKYIVTMRPGISRADILSHVSWIEATFAAITDVLDKGVEKVWTLNFKGYSGEFSPGTIDKIRRSPEVASVEPVQVINLFQAVTQTNAPWGLGAISHRTSNTQQYIYDDSAGVGTWAYIVDTGVNSGHQDFEGRAFLGYNACKGSAFNDTQGHGTHCAGVVASKTYGVAKKANVMAVKVFGNGSTTLDVVLDGYEWAVKNITNTPGRVNQSVISLSLGGGQSPAFNAAIANANSAGVLTVVAAGNNGNDAKNYSPASAPQAITVGAIDETDRKADFSNYGSLVDIFAPGVDIPSTWIGGPNAAAVLSGTSMACPHVAGLSLYLMAKEHLGSPATISARIQTLGTRNVVANAGPGSPNLLAYNGIV